MVRVLVYFLLMNVLSACTCFSTCIVPALSLNEIESASAFGWIDDGTRENLGEVEVKSLFSMMSRATWISNTIAFHKGSTDLRLSDGRVFLISTAGPFFEVEGVPGYYLIKVEDVEAFEVERLKLVHEHITLWKKYKAAKLSQNNVDVMSVENRE